jgi:GT2 family glycosyltransferase
MESRHRDFAVFVVDNGSTENEAVRLAAEFPAIRTVRLPENSGYAAAANAGVRAAAAAGHTAVLLLNNDTTVADDALLRLEESARTFGQRAIVAPLITTPSGAVWSAGGSLRWPWVAGEHVGLGAEPSVFTEPRRVDWASGCALFFAVSAFEAIGDFDERYFLYLEDMDWCLRARRAGYEIWCAPSARISHEVTKTVNAMDPRITRYYAYRNFYLTGLRHAPVRWRVWLAGHLVVSLVKVSARNAFSARHRADSLYNARTRGILDFIRGRTGKAPYPHEIIAAPAAQSGGTAP